MAAAGIRPLNSLRTGNLTGNFSDLRPIRRFLAPIPAVISIRCSQIPCYPQERKLLCNFNALQANSLFLKEQGIFLQEQGIYSAEQGISWSEQGIRFP
jgi:hypothetical protein